MPRPFYPNDPVNEAEAEYRAEARDRYEACSGVPSDLVKLEKLAAITLAYQREARALIRGLEFADPRMTPVDYSDRDRCEMILETFDDLMSGEAQRVVSSHVAKACAAPVKEAA